MSSSSMRKHAGAGPASGQPTAPEPAFAERARRLGTWIKSSFPISDDRPCIRCHRESGHNAQSEHQR